MLKGRLRKTKKEQTATLFVRAPLLFRCWHYMPEIPQCQGGKCRQQADSLHLTGKKPGDKFSFVQFCKTLRHSGFFAFFLLTGGQKRAMMPPSILRQMQRWREVPHMLRHSEPGTVGARHSDLSGNNTPEQPPESLSFEASRRGRAQPLYCWGFNGGP